jgi:hypothetical protein
MRLIDPQNKVSVRLSGDEWLFQQKGWLDRRITVNDARSNVLIATYNYSDGRLSLNNRTRYYWQALPTFPLRGDTGADGEPAWVNYQGRWINAQGNKVVRLLKMTTAQTMSFFSVGNLKVMDSNEQIRIDVGHDPLICSEDLSLLVALAWYIVIFQQSTSG